MDIYSQSKVFCIFFLLGIIINFIFDLFRALRKSFKFPNIIVFVQDILFLILSGCMFLNSLIKYNNGEIRFFIFLALGIGICIYTLTISKGCVIIITVIFKVFKKIFEFPYKIIREYKKIRGKIKDIPNI